MALDDMLGKLTVEKNGKQVANDKYSSSVLYEANLGISELRKTDLDSKEGLATYKNLTGEDPTKYSNKTLDLRKNVRLQGGQRDYATYVDGHFGKIVEEIDEPMRVQLAYSFCPSKDVTGKDAGAYNAVRGTVSNAEEIKNKIAKDPNAVMAEEMKKENLLMVRYFTQFQDELLELKQSEAQHSAVLAINKYGAGKFITDTRKHLSGQPEELREKQSELQKAIGTKIETAEKNTGRILTAVERASLISDKYKELQGLNETYADAELGMELTQKTVSYAIGSIEKKIEEEKAKTKGNPNQSN